MKVQTISQAAGYSKPVGIIDVEVHISINRELNMADNYFISQRIQQIMSELRKNTLLLDMTYQEELLHEREMLIGCFPEPVYVKAIPNGYSSDNLNAWFEVTTKAGVITIGWRKRVIVIDWSKSDITAIADRLFPNEDVTRYDRLIHAYGYTKAKEYITVLLNSIS